MIVAQITDLHIKRRGHVLAHMPHVCGPLRRTLATINALPAPPDCIIATGDLTESGRKEEYERLSGLIAESKIPVFLVPGNHDSRPAMRSVFFDHEYLGADGPVQYVLEGALSRIIALDSSEPYHRGGYLDRVRLGWLQDRLEEAPRTPTIIAMHHPPFPTGVSQFDNQTFVGSWELGAIIRRHPQVRRIICGHVHQVLRRPWNGVLAVSAPSTAPTLVLHPQGRGIFYEPGGFLLHSFDWDADITTELVRTSGEPIAIGA